MIRLDIRRRIVATVVVDPSRATTSDIYVPCPKGLNYLPYQEAAIEYALKIFGDPYDRKMPNLQ